VLYFLCVCVCVCVRACMLACVFSYTVTYISQNWTDSFDVVVFVVVVVVVGRLFYLASIKLPCIVTW
jgi:hypothetical protein